MSTEKLLDEIKRLKEQRKALNKSLKETKELLCDYKDGFNRRGYLIEDYEKLLPNKYYKVTYKISHFRNGEVTITNELQKSSHPDILIATLRQRHFGKGYLELIDILEVTS